MFGLWCCFIYNNIIIYFVWKINCYFYVFIIFFCIVLPPFLLILYTLTLQKSTLFTQNPNFFFSKLGALSVTSRYASSSSCSRSPSIFSMCEIELSAQAHCGVLALEKHRTLARCAGCEPLTFIVFVLSSSLILLIL